MSLPKDRAWFAAKRYGYGWGWPVRWQGWVVFCIYGGFMFVISLLFAGRRPLQFGGSVVVLTVLLVAVCAWKGEPARWRWGRSDGDDRKA